MASALFYLECAARAGEGNTGTHPRFSYQSRSHDPPHASGRRVVVFCDALGGMDGWMSEHSFFSPRQSAVGVKEEFALVLA